MVRRQTNRRPEHRPCLSDAEREARRNRRLARSLVAEMGVLAAIDHCLRNGLDQVLSALLGESSHRAA